MGMNIKSGSADVKVVLELRNQTTGKPETEWKGTQRLGFLRDFNGKPRNKGWKEETDRL